MAVVELKIQKRNTHYREIMHKHVDEICNMLEDGGELSAFTIVGFDYTGNYVSGWRISNDAVFGITLFPALVAETIRKRITENDIESALGGNLTRLIISFLCPYRAIKL